jgi:hypothetical protein
MKKEGQGRSVKMLDDQAVSICSYDSEILNEVSKIFKKIGIIPFYFRSLKEFWDDSLKNETPSLVIFDVKLMSEGNLALKSHPLVKAERLPICFIYSDENEPLLFSTYEIFNLGLIRKSDHILGQMKAMLRRFNKLRKFEKENHSLKKENEQKYEKIGRRLEGLSESEFFSRKLKEVCDAFSEAPKQESFFKPCAQIFETFDFISKYSFYEMKEQGKKLNSPDLFNFDKYLKLPSLWVIKEDSEAISPSSQKMGVQVVSEIFGNDFVSLFVRDEKKQVRKMIFLTFKNEGFYQKFDCGFLETFLDSFYSKFVIHDLKNIGALEKKTLNFWSFLSRIDNRAEEVVTLDLSSFLRSLSQYQCDIKLSWEDLMRDFIGEIVRDFSHQFNYTFESSDLVYFLAEENEKLLLLIKEILKGFSYRNYISHEGNELISFERPSVRIVNLGEDFIRKKIGIENLSQKKVKFQPREFI